MKLILRLIMLAFGLATCIYAQAQISDLSGVTLGFAFGPHYSLEPVEEYSLSPDAQHVLTINPASQATMVISSVLTVRLGNVSAAKGSSRLLSQSKQSIPANAWSRSGRTPAMRRNLRADPGEKWTLNISFNLAEYNKDGVAFNKSIDGGIGVGYSLNKNIQLAGFLDIQVIRQMRRPYAERYNGFQIPKDNGFYTSLDMSDNTLFTNRTFGGFSIKLIYALANKE